MQNCSLEPSLHGYEGRRFQIDLEGARPWEAHVGLEVVDGEFGAFSAGQMDAEGAAARLCALEGLQAIVHRFSEHCGRREVVAFQVEVVDVFCAVFLKVRIDESDDVFEVEIVFQETIVEQLEIRCVKCEDFISRRRLFACGSKNCCLRERRADGVARRVPTGIGAQSFDGSAVLDEERQQRFLGCEVAAEVYESDGRARGEVPFDALDAFSARGEVFFRACADEEYEVGARGGRRTFAAENRDFFPRRFA